MKVTTTNNNKSNDTCRGRQNRTSSRIVTALFSTRRRRNDNYADADAGSMIETAPSWVSENDSIHSGNNHHHYTLKKKKKDHPSSSSIRIRNSSSRAMIQRRPTPPPSILKVKTLEYSVSLSYASSSSYNQNDTFQQNEQVAAGELPRKTTRVAFDNKVDIHYYHHDTIIDISSCQDGSIVHYCLDWKKSRLGFGDYRETLRG